MTEKLKEYRDGFLQTVARLDHEIQNLTAALKQKEADRIANQGAADGLANIIAAEEAAAKAPAAETAS